MAQSTLIASPSTLDRSAFERTYLGWDYVPGRQWEQLEPRQRDLHLLWTKKLVPLFEDFGRIRRRDLSERELRRSKALLDLVGRGGLSFQVSPANGHNGAVDCSLTSAGEVGDERLRVIIDIRTSKSDMQRISIAARGTSGPFEIALLWLPQPDSERGSVMLFPDAMKGKHHFGIAAFNRRQFADISEALVEYLTHRRPVQVNGRGARS
jgi:hypothetical protein